MNSQISLKPYALAARLSGPGHAAFTCCAAIGAVLAQCDAGQQRWLTMHRPLGNVGEALV